MVREISPLKESIQAYSDSFLKRIGEETIEMYSARASFLAATRRAINYGGRNAWAQIARAQMTPQVAQFLSEKDFSTEKVTTLMAQIRQAFRDVGITDWTYGNSQKWVNIAIKYYFAYSICASQVPDQIGGYKHYIDAFHYELSPVDGIMIGVFKEKLNLDFYDYSDGVSWSNCDSLETFTTFWEALQNSLVEHCGEEELPIMFEFENFPITKPV